LAFVSPLPPAYSGIADYSAELLTALEKFYDIDVILEQSSQTLEWIERKYGVRDSNWLLQNSNYYDRVLYHFGNSNHHQHMLHLLTHVPGIVVLHDFYLGDLLNHLEANEVDTFACQRGLYQSHGYDVLAKRFVPDQRSVVTEQYPANFEVLQLALGVIVHSQHPKQLAANWYGNILAKNWSVIPLLRKPNKNIDRQNARQALGLQPGEFMVCSFGMLGAHKLNLRLLQSWLNSAMTRKAVCRLVFVGEEQAGEYGVQIRQAIQASGLGHCIQITGWTDPARYVQYLMAADLAVQLRTNTRGETSAAVLDCMNFSLPTIVNAHGAMAELPSTAVWMLDENFHNSSLTEAIDILWLEAQRRHVLGELGRKYIRSYHAPDVCADQYRIAIERDYAAVMLASASDKGVEPTEEQSIQMAKVLARPIKPIQASCQVLIDVSATCRDDLKTGIQRVVRALVWSLIQTPPVGCRIEPVYLSCDDGTWHYRYARQWTSKVLGIADGWMSDDPVNYFDGDVLLIADLAPDLVVGANNAGVFSRLKELGVGIHFFFYDLLPIQMPQYFPPGQVGFTQWLHSLTATADSALCISYAVAKDLQSWLADSSPQRDHALGVNWFHLGADLMNSIPSTGLAPDSVKILTTL
jgi:glycosyltransferase involved in cell wall biosynthesis